MVIISKIMIRIIPNISLISSLQGKMFYTNRINQILTIILLPINPQFLTKIQHINFPQLPINLISNTIFQSKMVGKENPKSFKSKRYMEIT